MRSRMDVLYDRAKPSRGSVEHQQLKAELGGVEPGPDHPRFEDFIRLTEPKSMGRPRIEGQPPAGTSEYNTWWRANTEGGQASYERQKVRQVEKYHQGPKGSGARLRADQRARQRGIEDSREQPNWEYGQEYERRIQQVMKYYKIDDRSVAAQVAKSHPTGDLPRSLNLRLAMATVSGTWEEEAETHLAAAKKPKPKKPRKPEEVWYDVHKHPEGVPGGMGKSPEHHLKNRGWSGHEINESAGRKTIQYRNHEHPDFVISYGGGTSQKPDHNFRVLYMGTNTNIPKVTRSYSVAEAMNKVEELHQLQSGLVVQPMIHGAGIGSLPNISQHGTFVAPTLVKPRNMNEDDNDHPIGHEPPDFPTRPDQAQDWTKPQVQVKEIKEPKPAPKKAVSVFQRAEQNTWEEA